MIDYTLEVMRFPVLKGYVYEKSYNLCQKNAIYAKSSVKDSFCCIYKYKIYFEKVSQIKREQGANFALLRLPFSL